MNGPFFFGIRDVLLAPSAVERCQRIACKHGIDFVYQGRIPGTPTTGWFEAPNRGEPFNRELSREVMAQDRA